MLYTMLLLLSLYGGAQVGACNIRRNLHYARSFRVDQECVPERPE